MRRGTDPDHHARMLFAGRVPEPAATPTTHPPGTFGKIEVMRRRNSAGQQILHPLDARDECDRRPYEFLRRMMGVVE